jgi:beta-glucosidase
MQIDFKRSDFPADFVFGAATAAYQIEGTSFGGCGQSHWDTFAATPGNIADNTNGSVACAHYNDPERDLDLVQNGNFDAYRFSAAWPRVVPDGRGAINQEGLDWYDRLVDQILARNLKPSLTLYHWDLPVPLADLGGWRNRDTAQWFADYADIITRKLGDRLFSTSTINEPWCVAWLSHFLGHHAPGLKDIRAAARAMHHILLAHGSAMDVMRANGQDNLGIVLNFEHVQPWDQSVESLQAAKTQDAIYNGWFLGALFHKQYPQAALDGLLPHMPAGFENDMDRIGQPMEWLGVNYYTTARIAHEPDSLWPHIASKRGDLPLTDMGWEVCPEGLHAILTRIERDYSKGLPVYVTENGMANAETILADGSIQDNERISYLNSHFAAARQAMADGVNLKGYFVWSLLDNYEWAFGYDKRFGIVHVDYETQNRTPKASWYGLQNALRRPA